MTDIEKRGCVAGEEEHLRRDLRTRRGGMMPYYGPTALGSQVRLKDGRVGTVVFNGLCGVGIKFGLHDPQPSDFEGTHGDLTAGDVPADWPWKPDALMREPWRDGMKEFDGMELVGPPEKVLRYGLNNPAKEETP